MVFLEAAAAEDDIVGDEHGEEGDEGGRAGRNGLPCVSAYLYGRGWAGEESHENWTDTLTGQETL